MFRRFHLSVAAVLVAVAVVRAEPPKVVFIGDSIRLGYAPLVAKKLDGKAVVVSNKANGGDSATVLKNLDEWVIKEKPDVVHLNCGLHDLKKDRATGKYQVPLDQYQANLRQIVARIRKETNATIVFALTTPIDDKRHAARKANFDRFEEDVKKYNRAALEVMKENNVRVDDLHAVVEKGGVETLLGGDGTHYTPAGYEKLADAVTDVVLRELKARAK